MESSVSLTSSELECFITMNCTVCERQGKVEAAQVFCHECGYHLCQKCLQDHNKFPANASHRVVDQTGAANTVSCDKGNNSGTDQESSNRSKCSLHDDKDLDVYCSDHDEICCRVCALLKHSFCRSACLIKDITIDKWAEELRKCHSKKNKLEEEIAEELNARQANIGQLNTEKEKVLQCIDKYEEKIIVTVRELANNARKEVTKSHKTHTDLVQEDVTHLETIRSTVKKSLQHRSSENDIQAFLHVKQCQQNLKNCKEFVKRLSEKWLQAQIGFSFDQTLQNSTFQTTSIGKVQVETKHNATIQAKLVKMIESEICSLDKDNLICLLDCGRQVVCKKKKLLLLVEDTKLHEDYIRMHHSFCYFEHDRKKYEKFGYTTSNAIQMPDEVVAICLTGQNEIACALHNQNKVQFVICDKNLCLGRLIDTDRKTDTDFCCTDLAYNAKSEELFMYCMSKKLPGIVKAVSKYGQCQRILYHGLSHVFYKQVRSRKIAYSSANQTIVMIDGKSTITALDTCGKILWTYTEDNTDLDGAVFCILGDKYLISDSAFTPKLIVLNKQGRKMCELNLPRELRHCTVRDSLGSQLLVSEQSSDRSYQLFVLEMYREEANVVLP